MSVTFPCAYEVSRGAGPFYSILISRAQTATGRPGRRERGPSTTDRTEEETEAMSSTVSKLLDVPHRVVIPDWFPLRAALGAPWLQHSERHVQSSRPWRRECTFGSAMEPILVVRLTLWASKVCRPARD